jgi:hypothetical protein
MKRIAAKQGWVWPARIVMVLFAAGVLVYSAAWPGAAAPIMPADGNQTTLPFLSWIDVSDSRGISAWRFQLSLDTGGLTSPDKFLWSSLTLIPWLLYQSYVMLALWFLEFVLSFSWLQWVAAPLIAVGDAMQTLVNTVGLAPTLLTLAALVGGLLIFKGRNSTAAWEIGMACLIAALASGIFAQPVRMVAGTDGLIVQANRAGQQVAAVLASGGVDTGRTPEQLRQAQLSQLVDVFVRQPSQLINFGKVLDGGPCEGAYNDVIKAGPYLDSTVRDKVSSCDKDAGNYAANPSAWMAMGSYNFMPAAGALILLAVLIGGSVILAGVWAMFQALKAIVLLVVGVVPGASRGSLMMTLAETAMSLVTLVFNSIFLSAFLLVVQSVLTNSSGKASPQAFMIVDVIILVAIIVYWKARQKIAASAHQLAQRLSWRPGGSAPTSLPQRQSQLGHALGSVGRTAMSVAQLQTQRAALKRSPSVTMVDARQQAAFFGMGGGGGAEQGGPQVSFTVPQRGSGGSRGLLPPGPDTPALPPGPTSPDGGGPNPSGKGGFGGTAKALAGMAIRVGAHAALAAVTGGGSAAVTAAKAGRVLQTARRAQVVGKLALAAGKTATTAVRPSPVRREDPPRPLIIRGEVVPNPPTPANTAPRPDGVTPARSHSVGKSSDRNAAARLQARLNAGRAARLAARRTR